MIAGRAPILTIDDLHICYSTRHRRVSAVNGVSLRVHEGEAVGIVGESGSGKSTLARAILGLLPVGVASIESGRIRIDSRDVTEFRECEWPNVRGNPVAMVFQDPLSYLNPVLRVGEQIAESVRRHEPQKSATARVAELLELVMLPDAVAAAYPHELSGGMRQRALLAVALGCRPRLLVADEPTTALDVTTQAEILVLLRDLRKKLGMSLLLISHDLAVVAAECERIYVMYAGRSVEWGRSADVFGASAHPYTVGLLQSSRAEKDRNGRFRTVPGDVPNLERIGPECSFSSRCGNADRRCEKMPEPQPAGSESHEVRCWNPHGRSA